MKEAYKKGKRHSWPQVLRRTSPVPAACRSPFIFPRPSDPATMEHCFDRSYDAATPRLLHLSRHIAALDAMTLKPDDYGCLAMSGIAGRPQDYTRGVTAGRL